MGRGGGLGSRQAVQRLVALGENRIEPVAAVSVLRMLLRQFESPLVLILVFDGTVSALLREWADAAIVLAIVLGSSLLGFVQEFRAERAVARMRERLALTSRAWRDGELGVVPSASPRRARSSRSACMTSAGCCCGSWC